VSEMPCEHVLASALLPWELSHTADHRLEHMMLSSFV
jgi:hypothetical protein